MNPVCDTNDEHQCGHENREHIERGSAANEHAEGPDVSERDRDQRRHSQEEAAKQGDDGDGKQDADHRDEDGLILDQLSGDFGTNVGDPGRLKGGSRGEWDLAGAGRDLVHPWCQVCDAVECGGEAYPNRDGVGVVGHKELAGGRR